MNNNQNNELNDFLNKSKQNLQDDFEKDAFEGFESIESKEEAFELKASLDKKIAPLFAEKKQNFRVIWYAAAGLILVIGLSVFFIQTNADSIAGNKNVSLVDVPKKEPVETLLQTESVTGNSVNTTNNQKEEAKAEEKNKSNDINVAGNKKIADNAPMEEEAEKLAEVAADDRDNNQSTTKSEKSDLDKLNLAKGTTKPNSTLGDGNGVINDEVSNTKSAPVTTGGVNSRDVVKPQKEEDKKMLETTSTVAANNKSSAQYETRDSEGKDANINKYDEKVVSGKKSKARKKVRSEANQPAAVTEEQLKEPGFYKNNEGPKATVDAKSDANQCYYIGGETTLKKDISEKLNAKNLNKKFDAVLFVNEKKQVEKVNFTNLFDLNNNDKKTIESELKTLNKFNFYINPTTKMLFEFKLEYRP
jgi:hypothetical protein